MLLHRVARHVRNQNWFAVTLDFVVVVVGILFALATEQWLSDRQQRIELAEAEIILNYDLLNNLFAAREIVAIAPCRKTRTQILSDLLEQDGDHWDGMPWQPNPGAFQTRLPELLPTPYRHWGSRLWNAEQGIGALALMDPARRRKLDTIFNGADLILSQQEVVFRAQSRLKTLAMQRGITTGDRVRYLDLLHYHDQQAGLLERMASQTLEQIESIGFRRDESYVSEFNAFLPGYLKSRASRYGKCFSPFNMPFLDQSTRSLDRHPA